MTTFVRAFALASTLLFAATTAQASDITVDSAWARASAGMAKAGGSFMTIKNAAHHADRLVAAKSDISTTTELHTHIKEGDIMRMRQVDGIDVPAMGSVELMPGGLHVMYMGLVAPLKEGDTFPLTLSFEKAGDITVTVTVKGVGTMSMEPMKPGEPMPHHGAMPGHKH